MYKGKESLDIAYYISSLDVSNGAKFFSNGIRNHWLIENSLHYVKDKTFNEDNLMLETSNSSVILSFFFNFVINIFRNHNYVNIRQAIRLLSNDIPSIISLLSV